MSGNIHDNFRVNSTHIAYNQAVDSFASTPAINSKENTEDKINQLKRLFTKKDPAKLKEAEIAINNYDASRKEEVLQEIGHPLSSIFLLEAVSIFDKEPSRDIVSKILTDPDDESEITKNLKRELSEIPPTYLEILSKKNWKILIAKNGTDLIKSGAVETKNENDALLQNQEILKKINNELPELKLNIDPGNIKMKDLNKFRGKILEKISEELDRKIFYNPKEHKENLDRLFMSASLVKKIIRDCDDPNPQIDYLFGDSIESLKALDDFYNLNIKHNGQYISMEELEFLNQWEKGMYASMSDNKHNLIIVHPDLYKHKTAAPLKISTIKHEIYHAVEGTLMEEAPLYFLQNILPETTKNYLQCKRYDNDPRVPGSPGTKDKQEKTHEFLRYYSATNKEDYCADTFSAYFDPQGMEMLKKNDPNQYVFIKNLTDLLELAKNIAKSK